MAKQSSLATLLTQASLRAIAGSAIYARGAEYQRADAVSELRVVGDTIRASVAGSSFPEYAVALWVERGQLDFSCTCPMGEEGDTCKHVVAVGLAWLAGQRGKGSAKTLPGDTARLRAYLDRQSKETLAAWLLAHAAAHPSIHEELETKALLDTAGLDVKALKQAIDKALRSSGFTPFAKVQDMVRQARRLIDQITRAGDGGGKNQLAQVADLAEHAMRRGLRAYLQLDDSSGYFNGFLHELSEWYRQALAQAGTSRPLKGAFFYKLKQEDEWGFFALEQFGPLLSKSEYRSYCRLAQAEWDKVPAATSGRDKHDGFGGSEWYAITGMMEEIARYDNDSEALIRIKRKHLNSPWNFLQLAETFQQAGRDDDALATAEEGLSAFPERWDSRLVEFLLGAYRARKQSAKAIDLAWRYFQQASSHEAYLMLKKAAGKRPDWHDWRRKALQLLGLDGDDKRAGNRGAQHELIEILLDENDVDTALQAANRRGAGEAQWLRLAQACEKAKPAEAVTIYRRVLPGIVERKTNQAYEQAATLAATVRRLQSALGQQAEFSRWFAELCSTHKAKRNFLQRLAGKGLPSA